MNHTFHLSEQHEELIHRVFGGTKIIRNDVTTLNTGGYFMHDLYPTEDHHLVVVYEYGAIYFDSREQYDNNEGTYENQPGFDWDKPLEYAEDE